VTKEILGISTDNAKGILVLDLDDGSRRELGFARLRASCRCAECLALQRRGGHIEAGNVSLRAIEPVGSHALNLHFSDGHARGIYPLVYLLELAR
jgi:DUF971 family protein